MKTKLLKQKIIQENKLNSILIDLGMHHIQSKDTYFSCGMPDGNRTNSTIIYKDSLHVDAYTRNIEDKYGHTDLISLVCFVKKLYISQAIKWLCDICGYSYYEDELVEQPESLKWLDEIYEMNHVSETNEEYEKIKPVDEKLLKYYGLYQNKLFLEDNIDLKTQKEFEYGYDLETHSVTIPIRDEIGTLVGIKARLYKKKITKGENKYFYIASCPKSKILYGLHKTLPYIKECGEVIVVESEKAVAQLWCVGIKNAVSIGGHILSKTQVKKLTHLGVNVILAYDQGVGTLDGNKIDKSFYRKEFDKFLKIQPLAFLFDKSGKLLKEKESPADNIKVFKILYKNKIVVRK